MSIISIQVGQCGNQIGSAFYEFMGQELQRATNAHQALGLSNFFIENKQGKHTPRALLIDMEPKVVNSCLDINNGLWKYDPCYSFVNQEGSGNNWSYGFNSHGPKCQEKIFEKFYKMLENTDYVDGVVFMQSLAGGTGSGLGSYLTEQFKDEFPNINTLNIAVLPHFSGEVILQSYNCVLSIASLQSNSDGMILIENDSLQMICNKLLNIKNPRIEELNSVVANQLCSIFFPVVQPSGNQNKLIYSEIQNKFTYINDICDQLLCDPNYKILNIQNVPQMPSKSKEFTNETWLGLEKRIHQMMISNSTECNINWGMKEKSQYACKYRNYILIARGIDLMNYELEILKQNNKLYKDSHIFAKNDRSFAVIGNSQAFLNQINTFTARANDMFYNQAYFYQYEKYGLTKDMFISSLSICEQIIYNYANI